VVHIPEHQRQSLIYLTGFMGSGKSTIGPILANVLGFNFTDVDTLIERLAGKRVVEIFATDGEARFRTLERRALESTTSFREHVVSLGGGTLSNQENLDLIRHHGLLVYLQLSPEEIFERVSHRTDRPMLHDEQGQQLPPDAMKQRICDLLAVREVYYTKADIIVPVNNRRLGTTVDEIVRRVRKFI